MVGCVAGVVIVRVPLGQLGEAHLDAWGRVPSRQWYGHLE
jgi:hypothetical protein